MMAKQLVEGGLADCTMALGFEKMERGSLGNKFTDRTNPLELHMNTMMDLRGYAQAPPAPQASNWVIDRVLIQLLLFF